MVAKTKAKKTEDPVLMSTPVEDSNKKVAKKVNKKSREPAPVESH